MEREYAEYLLRKTKEDYNLIAEDYTRTRAWIPEDIKTLGEYTFAGEKVLDLGCASGRFLEILEDKKVDYFGIDISEKLIEIAKKKYPKGNFQVADALNLPFPNNFFDKIFSIAVLHHIPSGEFRLQFLKETKRVLKKEGLLIITVWNLWQRKTAWCLFFRNTFFKLIGKTKLDFKDIFYPWKNQNRKVLVQRYFHLFTKRELKKMVEKVDFKIKEVGILERPARKDNNIYIIAEK